MRQYKDFDSLNNEVIAYECDGQLEFNRQMEELEKNFDVKIHSVSFDKNKFTIKVYEEKVQSNFNITLM